MGAALERNKDAAIAITDEENYNRYMKYLTGCQFYFVDESLDVSLVTYLKPAAAESLPREADSVCRTLHVPIDTVLRSRAAFKGSFKNQ